MKKYDKVIRYNKLIRDLIPDMLEAKGVPYTAHVASDEEYRQKLKEKLQEEVDEFLKEENPEELADILEVIHALAEILGVSPSEIKKIRVEKAKKRGGFKKRIILEES